ncbi:UNVERIFIED_CONTAM: hypothetical protein K2H54_072543 [Gekko kuhli]
MDCYQIPVTYHNALNGGSPYYFAAELPPGNLPEPAPFTVGDNRTYQGFWNPPLTPRKGYNIYFQAMSSVEKELKRSNSVSQQGSWCGPSQPCLHCGNNLVHLNGLHTICHWHIFNNGLSTILSYLILLYLVSDMIQVILVA